MKNVPQILNLALTRAFLFGRSEMSVLAKLTKTFDFSVSCRTNLIFFFGTSIIQEKSSLTRKVITLSVLIQESITKCLHFFNKKSRFTSSSWIIRSWWPFQSMQRCKIGKKIAAFIEFGQQINASNLSRNDAFLAQLRSDTDFMTEHHSLWMKNWEAAAN